jgi:PAS domain S-box-containing protein
MEIADRYIREKRCNKNQMAVMLNFSNPSNFSACYHKYLEEKSADQETNQPQKENINHYKTLIEEAPITIAIFNMQMQFIAVSESWIAEYGLQNTNFLEKSIYEILPDTKKKCEKQHLHCLKGHIYHCDGLLLKKNNGIRSWLKWNIYPWFTPSGEVGGLCVHTEDISKVKAIEKENERAAKLLKKAATFSKIGTWTRDMLTHTTQWDKIIQNILELPDHFVPDIKAVWRFIKQGKSQNLVKKALRNSLKYGVPFDIEVEMITAGGNSKRIRIIGYPELQNNKCKKLSGILFDVTPI